MEVKSISCYEKENMPISKVVQLFISKKMVEEHCSVHSIKICKRSSCIAPLSLSFGINPLPVQFKALLHGQKGWVFFSGHLNLRTAPETGLPSREKNHNN